MWKQQLYIIIMLWTQKSDTKLLQYAWKGVDKKYETYTTRPTPNHYNNAAVKAVILKL